MGMLAAFVGYAASFAIVLSGLRAMGANEQQAATGLFFATLGMGVCSIWLAWITRIPAAVAWSTPGAAFLASTAALAGGFAEAVAAFIVCAILLIATGVLPLVAKLVASIPKQIANGLLAGVLLKLCFAPALAIGSMPQLFLPILFAWVAGLVWHKIAAMPMAVLALIAVLIYHFKTDDTALTTSIELSGPFANVLVPVMPHFSIEAIISVALPLYLITMAGQNIPGFAVLELNQYKVSRQPLLTRTGLISLLIAPFGSVPVNMSAIVAAMMCSDDAGRDTTKRYQAALSSGVVYVVLALAAGAITKLVVLAPGPLISGVAGLALIPALIAALSAAFDDSKQLEAPALTFLIAASGMTLLGISGALWGLVVGVAVWWLKRWKQGS